MRDNAYQELIVICFLPAATLEHSWSESRKKPEKIQREKDTITTMSETTGEKGRELRTCTWLLMRVSEQNKFDLITPIKKRSTLFHIVQTDMH